MRRNLFHAPLLGVPWLKDASPQTLPSCSVAGSLGEDSETLGRDAVRDLAGFNLLFNAQRETKTIFW